MANSYTLSVLADGDIQQIVKRSLENFGEQQTDTYLNGLENALDLLAETPGRGRDFRHRSTGTNYCFYRYISHVIYYQQRNTEIFITRILHIKMLPENHL